MDIGLLEFIDELEEHTYYFTTACRDRGGFIERQSVMCNWIEIRGLGHPLATLK
jgi:hypothetical protein